MTVVFAIFAIGDFVSSKTKAMCSMMFVSAVLLLAGFLLGVLPTDLFITSGLQVTGGVLVGFLLVHMGTLLDLKEFSAQWKTVAIGVAAMIGIGLIMIFVAPIFIEKIWAIASAPVVAGGIVAVIIMGEGTEALGLPQIKVFMTLLVAIQGFIGFPITSVLLRKESRLLKAKFAAGEGASTAGAAETKQKRFQLPLLPETIRNSAHVIMAKLGILVIVSTWIATSTNNVVHRFVICLVVGIIAKEIRFLDDNSMVKANSFGFAMVALLAVLFGSLNSISGEALLSMAYPMLICFALGVIAVFIFSPIAGKLLKVSPWMSIAIGISCLVGFPGTFIISNEVAKSMSDSDEECKFILGSILPKMLVAGFTTVTVGSVIMAGFMVKLIQ